MPLKATGGLAWPELRPLDLVYDFINQLSIVVIVNIFFFASFFFCGKVQYCE
jgi:hypothetical protein